MTLFMYCYWMGLGSAPVCWPKYNMLQLGSLPCQTAELLIGKSLPNKVGHGEQSQPDYKAYYVGYPQNGSQPQI